jgi:uncharacterized membrane protein
MPLCARCSGIYSGFFIGSLFQYVRNRKITQLPASPITYSSIALILLILLQSVEERFHWWESTNDERFLMGLILGSAISVLLLPLFNVYITDKNDSSFDGKSCAFLAAILFLVFMFHYTPFSFHFLVVTSTVGVLALYVMASFSFAFVLVSYRKKTSSFFPDRTLAVCIGILFLIIEVFIFKIGK